MCVETEAPKQILGAVTTLTWVISAKYKQGL